MRTSAFKCESQVKPHKPILMPKELSEIIEKQSIAKSRGFEADYLDGAHDMYVLLVHKGLIKHNPQ